MAKQRTAGKAGEGGTGRPASAGSDPDGHGSRAQFGMMAQFLAAEMRRGMQYLESDVIWSTLPAWGDEAGLRGHRRACYSR